MSDGDPVTCVMCGAPTLAAEASMSAHGLMCSACHAAEVGDDAAQMEAQAAAAKSAVLGVAGSAALGVVGVNVLSKQGLGEAAPRARRMPVAPQAPRADRPWYAGDLVLRFVEDGLSFLATDDPSAEAVVRPLATLASATRRGRHDLVLGFDDEQVDVRAMASADGFLIELAKRVPELERYDESVTAKEALTVPGGVVAVLLLVSAAIVAASVASPDGAPSEVVFGVPALLALSLAWFASRAVRRPTRMALRRRR